jgi:predicted transcriptional regulator
MQPLIDGLIQRPSTKKQLLSMLQAVFPSKTREALRKLVERNLQKLQSYGLVQKRGDYYCWYLYLNDFKSFEDRDAKLSHSRKLVPALRRLVGISLGFYSVGQPMETESQEDSRIRDVCAETHLASYPDIWKQFEDFRRNVEQAEREKKRFSDHLKEKLTAVFGEGSVQSSSARGKSDSYVSENMPSLIYRQILEKRRSVDVKLNEDSETIWVEGIMIAKGKSLLGQITDFITEEIRDESNLATVYKVVEIEKRTSEVQSKLQECVRRLIMRIEAGEPLLGGCDTCPKVYVRADTDCGSGQLHK